MYLQNQKREKTMTKQNATASQIEAYLAKGGKITVCKPQARVSALAILNRYTARCKDDTIAHRGRKGMNHNQAHRCNLGGTI